MKKYDHAFTVSFTVINDSPDITKITKETLLTAMKDRVADLSVYPEYILDAVEGFDTIKYDDAPIPFSRIENERGDQCLKN